MSKYQLRCSCVHCHTETTVQSLKAHAVKCTSAPPNSCQCCGKVTHNEKYCSRSCRTTVVNAQRPKKQKGPTPKELREAREYQRFIEGQVTSRPALRKMLAKQRGYACERCGISEWNSEPITLVVDHKDGNAGNNMLDNLQMLCPNCNSQTPTFGGRNRGNGRKARGLPLH